MKQKLPKELAFLEKMTPEQACRKLPIQSHFDELQTADDEKRSEVLHSIASIAHMGKRRDCVYALAGYFALEVKTLDDIELFCRATWPVDSPELTCLVLKALVQNKDASRRKLLMDDLLRKIEQILWHSPESADSFKEVVESSVWGVKMKKKFLRKIWETTSRQE